MGHLLTQSSSKFESLCKTNSVLHSNQSHRPHPSTHRNHAPLLRFALCSQTLRVATQIRNQTQLHTAHRDTDHPEGRMSGELPISARFVFIAISQDTLPVIATAALTTPVTTASQTTVAPSPTPRTATLSKIAVPWAPTLRMTTAVAARHRHILDARVPSLHSRMLQPLASRQTNEGSLS